MFNINKYKEIQRFLGENAKNTKIIAISKNHPQESIFEAINAGVSIFGENRVMEAKSKFEKIKIDYPNVELHLTGPLQSNKVKEASLLFDVFHTLDREKIAKEFHKNADNLVNKKFFIQVNTGEETNKSGVYSRHLKEFLNYCKIDMKLSIIGLMCIPPIEENPEYHFKFLQNLAKQNNLNELSMGMSGDYNLAIKYHPSYIRLGTILFGKRQ